MIRIATSPLEVAALTHPGLGGRSNEDRFAISSYQVSEKDARQSVFAILSDGIGGHRAGEVAAEMAVETISHMVAQAEVRHPLEVLEQAIQVTSDAIAARAENDAQRLGMGTTCACAWIIGSQLFIASVGDSRVYLLRQGELQQLTVDHTWVQEAVESGILAPEEARRHPNVHVIRRYLGSIKTPRADTRLRLAKDESDTQARSHQGLILLPGDLLLLCTDGLTDVVAGEEIGPLVRDLEIHAAAQALVDLALSRQAKDNITVVLLKMTQPPIRKGVSWRWVLLGAVLLLLLALVVLLATWAVFHFILPPPALPVPQPG